MMDGIEMETNNTSHTAFVIGICMIELQPGKSGAMAESMNYRFGGDTLSASASQGARRHGSRYALSSTGLPANARCRARADDVEILGAGERALLAPRRRANALGCRAAIASVFRAIAATHASLS